MWESPVAMGEWRRAQAFRMCCSHIGLLHMSSPTRDDETRRIDGSVNTCSNSKGNGGTETF